MFACFLTNRGCLKRLFSPVAAGLLNSNHTSEKNRYVIQKEITCFYVGDLRWKRSGQWVAETEQQIICWTYFYSSRASANISWKTKKSALEFGERMNYSYTKNWTQRYLRFLKIEGVGLKKLSLSTYQCNLIRREL